MTTHYQGVQKDSAGFKLLKSMGWSEGEGLGANKQGMKEHIRVKKKFENYGVGAMETHNRTSNWSNGMNEFHRVLSSLSEITSKHANGSGSSSDEGGEGGEEAEAPAVRTGKSKRKDGKQRKRDAKESKTEKKRKRGDKARKDGKDGNDGREDASDAAGAPPKGEKQRATHIGRFKRGESSKMVKGYSSSDLAAILGEDPFAKQAASLAAVENAAVRAESSSDDDEDVVVPAGTAGTATAAFTTPPKNRENAAVVAVSTVDEDSWWSGYFMVGPRAGSRSEKLAIKAKKKVGFSEADQEALDTRAHSHATQGKVGLGRSSMKKTIGGAKWEGKKTKLGSDSEGEDEDAMEKEQGDDDDAEEDNGIQVVMPKKRTGGVSNTIAERVSALLGKEKRRELKVKALAKAVEVPKEELLDRLKALPGKFKLSKSKSRVSLVKE